jgi:hypothetical protein
MGRRAHAVKPLLRCGFAEGGKIFLEKFFNYLLTILNSVGIIKKLLKGL